MAKNDNLTDFLKGLADKFRSVLGTADPLNPQDFEDKIQTVRDEAYSQGFAEGGPTGITATAPDVLSGKVFGSGGSAKATGTMPQRERSTQAVGCGYNTNRLFLVMNYGYYPAGTSFDHPNTSEVYFPEKNVASTIGLTAAKLLKGQTVLGITGTGTGTLQAGYSYRYAQKYDSKALAGSIFKKASSGKLAFAKSVSNLPMVIVGGGGDAHTNTQTIKIGSRTIATKVGTLGTVKKVTVSASANEEITVDGDYNGSQWFLAVL
ncbi:hypothetical protein JQM64_06105 [Fournierella massiliensis]|nr:hypothetical protein [Fournierella massiliensis]MCF2557092.1 hypothetical protein [Fournierella massiliensis]